MNWNRFVKHQSDKTSIQAFRFIVVGLVAFAIDYCVMVIVTEWWHWHHLASAAFGYVVGLQVNYVMSVRWVFHQRRFEDAKAEFLLFTLIGVSGLFMTEFILWCGTDLAGIDYRITKFVALFFVSVWHFALRKTILFSDIKLRNRTPIA